MSEPEVIMTHHGLLIAWGQFDQATGLGRVLEAVPLS